MSQRTGKKRAGFGIAAAFSAAILSACVVPASQAMGEQAPELAALNAAPADAAPATAALPAAAAAASGTLDPARIAAGRDLFGNWGCSACHTLSDAKANGAVGPSLDGDSALTEDFIVTRVTGGQGAMPAFGGQLTTKEIADIAYYINHVAKK